MYSALIQAVPPVSFWLPAFAAPALQRAKDNRLIQTASIPFLHTTRSFLILHFAKKI